MSKSIITKVICSGINGLGFIIQTTGVIILTVLMWYGVSNAISNIIQGNGGLGDIILLGVIYFS